MLTLCVQILTMTRTACYATCLFLLVYATTPQKIKNKTEKCLVMIDIVLLTYCLQEADVFPQGAHAATEGEEEHEDPHHHQHHSRVH